MCPNICFLFEQFLIVAACPGASWQGNSVAFETGGAPFLKQCLKHLFLRNTKKHQELQNEVSKCTKKHSTKAREIAIPKNIDFAAIYYTLALCDRSKMVSQMHSKRYQKSIENAWAHWRAAETAKIDSRDLPGTLHPGF